MTTLSAERKFGRYRERLLPSRSFDAGRCVTVAGGSGHDNLDQFEQLMFLSRAEENLPPGDLDYAHYRAVHKHFFQDVYDWAGEIRHIRTAKGGNWFCYPENIDAQMESLFSATCRGRSSHRHRRYRHVANRAAHYISEINAVHPFREGTGRCQLTLLSLFLRVSGWELDENQLDPNPFMAAMIASFHGDNGPLARAIEHMSIAVP